MEFTEKTREFIDSWKNDGTKLPGPRSSSHRDIYQEITQAYPDLEHLSMSQKLWMIQNNRQPSCPECGSPSNLTKNIPIRERCCSTKCARSHCSDRIIQTNQRRYGGNSPMSSPDVVEKVISRTKGKEKPHRQLINKAPQFYNKEWLVDQHVNQNKTSMTIAKENGVTYKTVCKYIDSYGIPRKRNRRSAAEDEILQLLKENTGLVFNTNTHIKGVGEVDLFLDNFAIEYDGMFWHTHNQIPSKKDRLKGQTKKLGCMERGISLIQIWEHEWSSKKDIVLSMILNQISSPRKEIRASRCDKVVLSPRDALQFFDENHIQGRCPHSSGVYLGLVYWGKLVAVMSFAKPRFNTNYYWELVRFCVRKRHRIMGGAGRLFKWFLKEYSAEGQSIISYCNLRYGTGKLYDALGFQRLGITDPSYFYYNPNTYEVVSRYRVQGTGIIKYLREYYDTMTEMENMLNGGYRVGYDSGNSIHVFDHNYILCS